MGQNILLAKRKSKVRKYVWRGRNGKFSIFAQNVHQSTDIDGEKFHSFWERRKKVGKGSKAGEFANLAECGHYIIFTYSYFTVSLHTVLVLTQVQYLMFTSKYNNFHKLLHSVHFSYKCILEWNKNIYKLVGAGSNKNCGNKKYISQWRWKHCYLRQVLVSRFDCSQIFGRTIVVPM